MIILYRYPSENGYSDIQKLSRGEKMSIPVFPEMNLSRSAEKFITM